VKANSRSESGEQRTVVRTDAMTSAATPNVCIDRGERLSEHHPWQCGVRPTGDSGRFRQGRRAVGRRGRSRLRGERRTLRRLIPLLTRRTGVRVRVRRPGGRDGRGIPPHRSCDFAAVQDERQIGKLPVLLVRMKPDLAMGDGLLKKTGAGKPLHRLRRARRGDRRHRRRGGSRGLCPPDPPPWRTSAQRLSQSASYRSQRSPGRASRQRAPNSCRCS